MWSCLSSRIHLFFRTSVPIVLAALMGACAELEVPDLAVDAGAPPASTQDRFYRETGIAGWYGKELHGKKTASGEVFDMHAISAAHRTLPLGTMIRVTNLENFKSVKLRITDRGPFVRTRIMDLSQGAAKELGFIAQGSARVKIETIEAVRDTAPYTVLAAVFTEQENARFLKVRLNKRFEIVSIVPFETNIVTYYRVWVGSYASEERAEQVAGKLTLEGLEPIVARKD
jgi:rare lipoprotein A